MPKLCAFFHLWLQAWALSPTDPDTAVTTQSAAFSVAASMSPSIPLPTRISVSASRVFRSFAAFSSNIATNFGFNSLACCSTRSVFLFAVSATTGTPKCFAAAMLAAYRACRAENRYCIYHGFTPPKRRSRLLYASIALSNSCGVKSGHSVSV